MVLVREIEIPRQARTPTGVRRSLQAAMLGGHDLRESQGFQQQLRVEVPFGTIYSANEYSSADPSSAGKSISCAANRQSPSCSRIRSPILVIPLVAGTNLNITFLPTSSLKRCPHAIFPHTIFFVCRPKIHPPGTNLPFRGGILLSTRWRPEPLGPVWDPVDVARSRKRIASNCC